ncbi:uncharacterized protein LOC136081612 [Hydra vulgaris]|uniref:Uncharacterized protein LOC136081612 n=1 Tax=Hydra vulgaris TaxID=6087 RepID=A0ABM4C0T8_HYDVU
MVWLMLLILRATRTTNWELHLECVRMMLPWYFAYDRVNYARYLCPYWLEMKAIDSTHQGLLTEFKNNWTVQRQASFFSAIACDQAIEQTCNRDCKTNGGITGNTLNRGAVQRWILSQPERSLIAQKCKLLSGYVKESRVRKDLDVTRIRKDEKSVIDVMETVSSMINPFENEVTNDLVNIVTGIVADKETTKDLDRAYQIGDKNCVDFIRNNLNSDDPDIFIRRKMLKLKTFASYKNIVKLSTGKTVVLKNDSNFWVRCLLIARNRDINMEEVLKYSLRVFPPQLASFDGSLLKTTKSKLMNILENKCIDKLSVDIPKNNALILDGMAVLQIIKPIPENFGKFSRLIFTMVMYFALRHKSNRVEFVTDRYRNISIEHAKRQRRAESGVQNVTIFGPDQKVPKQWKKFMSVGSNKEELVKFLLEERKSYTINEIEIFNTHGDSTYCFRNSICTELSELRSDHEEADTRLLLHCKHVSVSYAHVILASPDTDVFVSALYHSWFISATLHFETGCGNKQRILNVNKIAKEIGYDWCDAMIGFHSLQVVMQCLLFKEKINFLP